MKEKEQATVAAVKNEIVETTFDEINFSQPETEGGYDQVFFVKIKTKDCAYFEFSKKVGDKIMRDSRTTIQGVDGKLTKIILDSYNYENKEVKIIKLYIAKEIAGKSNLFIISSSYTQVARGLINSLLAHETAIDTIHIGVYLNNQGYASLKMLINGKKCTWKYSIEEQRKHIETIKNKKGEFVSNDYSDLDEMLEMELRAHLGVLFPEQEHVKFVEPKATTSADEMLGVDEATFGEDDEATDFFEIDQNN